MKKVPIELVNSVYDCARHAKVEVHNVNDSGFHKLCLLVRKFEKSLGESVSDDYWKHFLRAFKRYRFDVSSTPLPFNHPVEESPGYVEQLRERLARCDLIYPQFALPARELVNSLLSVLDTPSNPILAVCADIAGCGMDIAMLIREPRHIPAVERMLDDKPGLSAVEVISPSLLKSRYCYPELVVIGPSRWYSDYVFQSPRAPYIHIIKYGWMNDSKPSNRVFAGTAKYQGVVWSAQSKAGGERNQEVDSLPGNSVDPEDFLPAIDWDNVLRLVSAGKEDDSNDAGEVEEYASARFFQLEGEMVVPLDAAESARATVLMLAQEEDDPVQRIPVSSIETGMFLLVRTEGVGEYIVPVANRVLGKQSGKAREVQRDWKDQLRRRVRQRGLHRVVRDLKRLGSRRANHVNIRNWMSYRSIKTEDSEDFRAIMSLIGLADKFDDYWQTMVRIDKAHRSAGHLIRKRLLSEVRKTDLQHLEKLGKMTFELPGVEGGRLAAIRIQSVHPQTLEVNVAKLGHPLEMDGNLWLG